VENSKRNKILFVVPSLKNGGGTIRSLQNILLECKNNNLDFYVLPLCFTGNFKVTLKNCKIIEQPVSLLALYSNIITLKKHRFFIIIFLLKIFMRFLRNIHCSFLFTNMVCYKFNLKLKKDSFNTVVAFQEGAVTQFCSRLEIKKIAWIHCNYLEYLRLIDKKVSINKTIVKERKIYERYDNIICVSKYTKKVFLDVYSDFTNKTKAIYNILNAKYILDSSLKIITDKKFKNDNTFTIVSIGRLDPVKQFELIPGIAAKLKGNNVFFRWYILGNGEENEVKKLNEEIKRNHVEDYVLYLGPKMNPYPYIVNSDLLVNTSKSEACPYVVNEAKVLHVPVVVTNFGSAIEFIKHAENGYIASIDKIYLFIERIISNREVYLKMKKQISNYTYDNSSILIQIKKLFYD